ncbi:LAFA_0D06788g1_1 [Lachancea sp. 'fantastica']|nr:LAFA_0D06788g1_1 [Lachancea sp. 'fantastica']
MFKKKTEHDPFGQYLNNEPEPVQKGFLQKVVSRSETTAAEQDAAANSKYNSPFRNSQQLAAAQKRKSQKFPTVSASGPGVTGPDLGYKVIDAARKRAKDIAVPRYLQGNDERQRRKLDKLERKEDSLQYKKDSQKIVDVREADKKQEQDEQSDVPEPVVETVAEPVAEPVVSQDAEQDVAAKESPAGVEAEATEVESSAAIAQNKVPEDTNELSEPVTEPVTEPVSEPLAEPVSEPLAEPLSEPIVNDSELLGAEVPEGVDTTAAVIATEEPESEAPAVAAAEETKPVTKASSVSAGSESAPADADNEPTTTAGLTKPKDIKEAPRVPFATGIFALWTRSDKRGQPVASPNDPEFIVRFDKGYMSKALYDTLEYEEAVHKQEMANYTKESDAKYDAKAQEYETNLTSLRSQISELEAKMDQLRKETTEKIKLSDTVLTTKMIESNAEHSNEKNQIFKETENIKASKVEEKESVEANQEERKQEIAELEKQKAEFDADFQVHQSRVDELTSQLDAKLAAIQELNAQQTEVQNSIDALTERKEALVAEAKEHDDLHASNVAVLSSIENKEYLPQLNAIDAKISDHLSSLTVIKQETANQEAEFAVVAKRLEEENEERKEKLRQEEEARKRAEEERLQKQRDEHDEQVLVMQQEHQRQLEEANQQALEAQQEHQRQLEAANVEAARLEQNLQDQRDQSALHERENVRLRGEQAIKEQEELLLADKALEEEMKAKSHSRAQALDAAETVQQKNAAETSAKNKALGETKSASDVLRNPANNATKGSSLFEYFTEKEIAYVSPSQSRA